MYIRIHFFKKSQISNEYMYTQLNNQKKQKKNHDLNKNSIKNKKTLF